MSGKKTKKVVIIIVYKLLTMIYLITNYVCLQKSFIYVLHRLTDDVL